MAGFFLSALAEVVKIVGNFLFTEALWPPFKRHVEYWWFLGDNIQELRNEIPVFEREMARLRGESATADVENWSNEATLKLEEARRILQGYHDLKVWSIFSRYSAGKNAKMTAEGLEKIRKDSPPPSMVYDEPSMEFQSRIQVEKEIMASLSDDHIHVIAICGAGGAGKTTMAHRIVNRVRRERLFDEVVMVVVSQMIEMVKVQEEIGELLGLDFSKKTLVGRAPELRNKLLDSKKKLLILDDVWESFQLGQVGVPLGECFTMGKIILTSRVKDACLRMNAQKIISLEILTEEEAWTLFKQKAGSYVEGSDLLPVAKQIVKECKGLPVSLVTVGGALKDQSMRKWRDALSQLKTSIPIDFPEYIKEVYKPLKLSYDFLESESMKSLFLLCCLFPEDRNINIGWLTYYCVGLGILEGIKNIEEGRNRTYSLLEMLKSRYVLISGSREHHVKMHDVVRDVAIYIGSKEKDGWLKSLEASSMDSSSNDSSCNCNWMSIDTSSENVKLLVWSDFPNLRFLIVKDRNNFFAGGFPEGVDANFICFPELNVLCFSGLNYRSFPRSLKLLKKLRTLHLIYCDVEDISFVGELASLEILIVYCCNYIKDLPACVGRLNHLSVLELIRCEKLKRIASGVISSLVRLEELKITECFDEWEPKENQSKERNASLSELESLPSLTCLEIDISNPNSVAQEIHLSQQLARYHIRIADCKWPSIHSSTMEHERSITLRLQGDVTVGNWIGQLLRSTQSLVLHGPDSTMKNVEFLESEQLELVNIEGLEEIIDDTNSEESNSFQTLESLHLDYLPKLEHLWKSQNRNVFGGNLKSICIDYCPNLRYVLSAATARCLVQLQHLEIRDCESIEVVLWNEIESNRDASILELPALKQLTLRYLPNLTTFSHGVEIIECPQLTQVDIEHCPKLKIKIFKCPNLRYIRLYAFHGLDHPLSSCVTRKWNLQLERIEIGRYDSTIEEILWDEIEDVGNRHIIFPELKDLILVDLPCLTTLYRGVESIKFPKLEALTIQNLRRMNSFAPMDSKPNHDNHSLHFFCNKKVEFPSLRYLCLRLSHDIKSNIWCHNIPINFFHNLYSLEISYVDGVRNSMSSSIAKNLVNLCDLAIKECPNMVEVVEDEREIPAAASIFPKLWMLRLFSLPKLRRFCQWKHAFEHPLLDFVFIRDCPQMELFTLGPLSTPSLRSFQIDDKNVKTKDLNAGIHDHFMAKKQEKMGNWSTRLRTRKRKRT